MTRETRRSICRALAAAVVAASLPFAAALAAEPGTVVFAQYGGLWQQTLQKALAPFEAEHNVRIRYVPGSSTDSVARAIAARNNPDVDVVLGEEMSFGLGHQEGIWEKLDPAIVTNLNAVVPAARGYGEDGVGFIVFRVGMFYRTDTFKKNNWAPPTSWSDLLDKKYCHRMAINHPNIPHGYYAMMILGGGKPDDFPAGVNRLAANKDCIDTLDPSAQKTLEKIQLGEYDIGISTDALIMTLTQRGFPVRFVYPKEGAVQQFVTASVTRNAPNPKLAQALVNELMSPRVQRVLVEQFNANPVHPAIPPRTDPVPAGETAMPTPTRFVAIETDAILKNRKRYIQDAVRILGQ